MSNSNRESLAKLQIEALNADDMDEAIRIGLRYTSAPIVLDALSFNSSGIFIDVGNYRADENLIRLGMQIAKAFLGSGSTTQECRAHMQYNLSNGYAALASVCEKHKDREGRLENWRLQRDCLQGLVLDRKLVPTDLITEVLTNFANVLDELGRTVEALDIWKQVLEINPGHPVASGSMGQAYLRLLNVQPRHNVRLIEAARSCLENAISKPDLIARHADYRALESYERSLDEVKRTGTQQAGKFDKFLERVHRLRTQHEGWNPDATVLKWAQSGLLLTINPYPEWCPDTLKDDLYFDGLGTEANASGQQRFTELAHTLNQIKEDFALARYLLLSSAQPESLATFSSVTQFADTLDYADFGLASAMLKSSIRTSVDIFDKIANFMNRYLRLGIPDKKVSFSRVWYEKGDLNKKVESLVLDQLLPKSGWLRGIRDVAENLNFYPAPSKDARDKATHDFLIIENAVRPSVRLHDKVVSVDAHEYARQMLMMVKGAVVNLMALVQREEGLRKSESGNEAIPLTFHITSGLSDKLTGN